MPRDYAIRYSIEPWNKPVENAQKEILPMVGKSNDNYGYSDHLFLVSIAYQDEGKSDAVSSVLLLDSRDGMLPNIDTLKLVKSAIEHHLQHHT